MNDEAIMFDTSVWVEYLGECQSKEAKYLKENIFDGANIIVTPTIIQEILQGVRVDADYNKLKYSLLSYECLLLDQLDAAIGAAELYRELRKKGVTVRKSNDCLIAWYAIQSNISIVHFDRDFDNIAAYTALKVLKMT